VSAYRDPKEMAHDPGRAIGAAADHPSSAASVAQGVGPGGAAAKQTEPGLSESPAGPVAMGGESTSPTRAWSVGLDQFTAGETIDAGDIASLSSAAPGSVVSSAGPGDTLVIGCAHAAPIDPRDGATLPTASTSAGGPVAVATSHIALCHVDASSGAIAIGDRLIASPAPGMAMRADAAPATATFLGRALDPLPSGDGLIRVLLTVR